MNDPTTMTTNYVVPADVHNTIVAAAYRKRGYTAAEADAAARTGESAARHGIKTHNAIKALHLDDHFGSRSNGCKPGAEIERRPSRFKAVGRWNANRKLGQAVALEAMDEVVVQMHAASGLTNAIRASAITVEQAEVEVLEFVARHVPQPRTAPLAGNSVHADRAFLHRYMPALEAYVHYRNVDVSTVKELARRWYPESLEAAPRKAGGHRALADIRESIEEMRYWRTAVFK
jgi:oligoribonuclease (3'-5' exoribonuclease)